VKYGWSADNQAHGIGRGFRHQQEREDGPRILDDDFISVRKGARCAGDRVGESCDRFWSSPGAPTFAHRMSLDSIAGCMARFYSSKG
jgi:hypothetical protein